jgi:GNAT superfamily N-acetyltransferase
MEPIQVHTKPCSADHISYSLYKLGTQGHIEDIAVIADQQGKRLGLRLLAALNDIAAQVGCYKVIIP